MRANYPARIRTWTKRTKISCRPFPPLSTYVRCYSFSRVLWGFRASERATTYSHVRPICYSYATVVPKLTPSASSSLDFGVEAFQFRAGVFDAELPINAALLGIGLFGPSCDFGLQFGQFAESAAAEALACQAA